MTSAHFERHIETLLHSITSITGHSVALEPHPAERASQEHHHWEVVGAGGDRYGVLKVHAGGTLPEPVRALYTHLSQVIAQEADLRREHSALERRFRLLDRQNAELAALQHSLVDHSYRDSLTGVYRRSYLLEHLRIELVRSRRSRRPLSVLLLAVAELASARATDLQLQELARELRTTCRTSDLLARSGPRELCAVLHDSPIRGAEELAARVRSQLALSASEATVATVTHDGPGEESAEALLDRAGQAVNRARRGR